LTGNPGQRTKGFVYEDYYYYSPPHPTGVLADVYARKHVTGRGVQQMLREGDYVAIRTQVHHPDDPLRLYDVVKDPHEDHNLADDPQYAQLLQQMRDELPAVRRPNGSAPRPYDNVLIPAAAATVAQGEVDADLFHGTWPWVPDFDALQAYTHKTVNGLDLPSLALTDDVGVKFSGYLKLPADGNYTFWLSDDDGAQFWLHEAHVLDDDFNHDGSAVSGSILLQAGLHPFRLFYRHGHGQQTLKLEIEGPGLPRQVIPSNFFASPSPSGASGSSKP
jgi:hypothetical protein